MSEDQKNNQPHDQEPKAGGWWARCREQMKRMNEHAKEFSTQSSGVVGKLYYLSLVSGGCLAAAGLYGVPGAVQGSVIAFGAAKIFKALWDHTRDVKDAIEDLDETGDETRAMERIDETTSKVQELEAVIAEQQAIIQAQMEGGNHLRSSHEAMEKALAESEEKIDTLLESQEVLMNAVKVLAQSEEKQDGGDREHYRRKYWGELQDAIDRGSVSEVPYDSEKDDFIRFEDEEDTEASNSHSVH